MNFRVIHQKTPSGAHSPYQVVEQLTGRGVAWINRFLDREYVRRLANTSLYSYAHSLLHFVRWWESIHHTGDIFKEDLADSTLLDYLRFPVQPATGSRSLSSASGSSAQPSRRGSPTCGHGSRCDS